MTDNRFYLMVFSLGALSFGVSFIVHVAVWRSMKPCRDLRMLWAVFLGAPILSFLGSLFLGADLQGVMLALLLQLLLAGAYIISYPAVASIAPTLRIVFFVASSKQQGVSESEIKNALDEAGAIDSCILSLKGAGLLSMQDNGYLLTPQGRLLAGVFCLYRRLLGLPQGEG